ncbi:lipopolysaccharide biosynthesis protein [Caulobacter vibrioides]|uniref:lipopolysaccharide biosynthesis protein n=1 Tax=Caulobacter vibrioides TaxID=155892 RepID=UPI000BB5159D|nr:lipopolysaccharide biosynthesis protein [Caulobacter vibrioides]ATC23459.1 lipopolysaccharide biosynthesis protein [Caulobacter vibrioides]PLR11954.1 hypothetical protein CVUC_11215 [Caulobacter vibrioides]
MLGRLRSLISRPDVRRIAHGISANLLGRLWVLALQVASVPVLTAKWGAAGYGQWLMLTAISTYIALSDFGFGNAAAASMIKSLTQDDPRQANKTFSAVWTLVSGVAALLILVISLAIWLLSGSFVHLINVDRSLLACISILSIHAFFAIQMNLLHVVYRSSGNYAFGTMMQEITYPLEGFAVLAVAALGYHALAASCAMLVIRVILSANFFLNARKRAPWFHLSPKNSDVSELRRLFAPAVATFNLNVSSAISLQGIVLSLGLVSGAAMAGLFGAARTISRAPAQFTSLITRATLPELTSALARDDKRSANVIMVINIATTVFLFTPVALAIALLGPFGLKILSHGRLTADHQLFAALAAAVLIQAIWQSISQYFIAINRPQVFAFSYTLIAIAVAAAPVVLSHPTATTAAMVALIGELAMLGVIGYAWRRESSMGASELRATLDHIRASMLKKS